MSEREFGRRKFLQTTAAVGGAVFFRPVIAGASPMARFPRGGWEGGCWSRLIMRA